MESEKLKIVLLGGGHSNIQVLEYLHTKLPQRIRSRIQIILINDGDTSFYSGMLPGAIAQQYKPEEIQIYLKPLSFWASAEFISSKVSEIEPNENFLLLETGEKIFYDYLSINIGSRNQGNTIPGLYEYTLPTRPLKVFFSRIEAKEEELKSRFENPVVIVVGGGAAGVEVCFSLHARLSKQFEALHISLITRSRYILTETSDKVRAEVMMNFARKSIQVLCAATVEEISENEVLVNNQRVFANIIIWATGAASIDIKSSIACCESGYFLVNKFLESVSHENVFAGGDCVTLVDQPLGFPPKAGVYAVREGPVIFENLHRVILGRLKGKELKLVEYKPEEYFLALLNFCDGRAVGYKGNKMYSGKLAWWLKNKIDKSFMKRFDPERLMSSRMKKEYQKFSI